MSAANIDGSQYYFFFSLFFCLFGAEVENAVEAFAKQLDVGHQASCHWRGNSCPESLVQFPPTPQSALIGGYKDRCDGLLQFQFLPIVAASAVELMRLSRGPLVDRFLSLSQNFTVGEGDFKPDGIPELEASRDGAFCLYSRVRYIYALFLAGNFLSDSLLCHPIICLCSSNFVCSIL